MSATSDLVQKLYVGYYGRPADPQGLAYWTQQIDSNPADLERIITAFENSPESQALYSPFQSIQERVTVLYRAFFSREPDLAGLWYWVHACESGNASLGGLTLAIMNGASGADQRLIDAQVQAANAFTAGLAADQGYHYSGAAAAAVGRTLVHLLSDPQQTLDAVLPHVKDFVCTADFASHNPNYLDGHYTTAGLVPLNIVSADLNTGNFQEHLGGMTDSVGSPGAGAGPAPDVTAPHPPALSNAAIVGGYVNAAHNTDGQVLTGSAEPLSTLTVFNHGVEIGQVAADGAGNWTFALGVLPDGAYSFTALATDAAGHASDESAALVFTVDSVAPAAPVPALLHDTGGSSVDRITQDATLQTTGVEDAATLQYSTDAVTWGQTFTPHEGSNTVYVRQIDAAGNVGDASGAFAFTLDTTSATFASGLTVTSGTSVGFTLNEAAKAGLYVGSTLLGSLVSAAAGVPASISIVAQPSLTSATLHVTDAAGNSTAGGPNVIIGTSGDDTIITTAVQDLMFSDGGSDTFQLTAGGAINLNALDQIGGFVTSGSSRDKIVAGGTAAAWGPTAVPAGWTLDKGMLSKAGATVGDFYAAVTAANGVAGQVAGFVSGGNTYLFGEGATTADGDNVAVVIVGLTIDTISTSSGGNPHLQIA